jgi:hypothetical protein
VRALFVPSPEAGIPNPRKDEWPRPRSASRSMPSTATATC